MAREGAATARTAQQGVQLASVLSMPPVIDFTAFAAANVGRFRLSATPSGGAVLDPVPIPPRADGSVPPAYDGHWDAVSMAFRELCAAQAKFVAALQAASPASEDGSKSGGGNGDGSKPSDDRSHSGGASDGGSGSDGSSGSDSDGESEADPHMHAGNVVAELRKRVGLAALDSFWWQRRQVLTVLPAELPCSAIADLSQLDGHPSKVATLSDAITSFSAAAANDFVLPDDASTWAEWVDDWREVGDSITAQVAGAPGPLTSPESVAAHVDVTVHRDAELVQRGVLSRGTCFRFPTPTGLPDTGGDDAIRKDMSLTARLAIHVRDACFDDGTTLSVEQLLDCVNDDVLLAYCNGGRGPGDWCSLDNTTRMPDLSPGIVASQAYKHLTNTATAPNPDHQATVFMCFCDLGDEGGVLAYCGSTAALDLRCAAVAARARAMVRDARCGRTSPNAQALHAALACAALQYVDADELQQRVRVLVWCSAPSLREASLISQDVVTLLGLGSQLNRTADGSVMKLPSAAGAAGSSSADSASRASSRSSGSYSGSSGSGGGVAEHE